MNKILTIAILMTLISGCTMLVNDGGGGKSDSSHTGTQGLVINWISNQPPSRIVLQDNQQSTDVVVGMELLNKGAEDITDGLLVYSGYDVNLVGWSPNTKTMPFIEGKSFSNPNGGKEINEVHGNTRNDRIGDVYRPVFQVTACYNYRTFAQIPLCIDPDPNGKSVRPCIASDFSASGGQGAPIAVTSVDQESAPGSTLFKITIKNAGGGDVFVSDVGACAPGGNGISYKDIDHVHFSGASLGTVQINCKGLDGNGNIPLTSGQGVIFCNTAALPRGSSYQTTLDITLDYRYRTHAEKNVEIVKLS